MVLSGFIANKLLTFLGRRKRIQYTGPGWLEKQSAWWTSARKDEAKSI